MRDGDEDKLMRLAIREARRSRDKPQGGPHPRVGAVVVKEGQILASACRGDIELGDHAEFGVLEKKLGRDAVVGCTVYTTLEPCTTRNHPKVPCAERLIERRVARVVIGTLDPDQRITGRGVLCLRRAGISVEFFPPPLMAELEELNRDFIRDREARARTSLPVGAHEAGLTAFYPSRDYYGMFRKDAATIDRYISTAVSSIVMVSINLMTGLPFNDLCACLKRKLRGGDGEFRVTLSLLDPRAGGLMEVVAPVLNAEPSELASGIHRSLRDLVRFRSSLHAPEQARLDIRVHRVLPFGSAIMLDHTRPDGRIQIETKPYKAGLQRSLALEISRSLDSSGLFETLVAAYEALMADGEALGHDGL